MDDVFILTTWAPYEGDTILGVFATRYAAKKVIAANRSEDYPYIVETWGDDGTTSYYAHTDDEGCTDYFRHKITREKVQG